MLDTMFTQETGLVARFLLRNITAIAEGAHLLAHLPFTPLYTDKTVLQVMHCLFSYTTFPVRVHAPA